MRQLNFTRNFLSFLFTLCTSFLFAQSGTQTIKGFVRDKDTRQPLIGATVRLADNTNTALGTVTDTTGHFRLENIPLGRQQITCSFVGYETYLSESIVLNAAKEVELDIQIIQAATLTDEVVVHAIKHGSEPLNELSVVSARSFSVEETNRYAGTANDAGRMAMGFPGVQISNDDSNSDILIRGNSGVGLLWRLEGIDIPNPNHFARLGSSGGGITIFSTSVLGTSDFSTGAFPAEYGNALSGVFDMKFRKGNTEKRENTIKVGLIGLEYSTEGPVGKNGGSYLVNYRYSTLGILNKLGFQLAGPRIDDNFQDISFNVYLPSKNKKHFFNIWGIGGLSLEKRRVAETPVNYDDRVTANFETNMGAVGVTHSWLIDNSSFIKTTLAVMDQSIVHDQDYNPASGASSRFDTQHAQEGRISISSYYSHKFDTKLTLKTGFFLSNMFYNFESYAGNSINDSANVLGKYATLGRANTFGQTPTSFLIQPYAEIRYRPAAKWTISAGIHTMFLTLNNTSSIEPRFGIEYKYADNQFISFGYGLHGKTQAIGTYYTVFGDYEKSQVYLNRNLGITHSNHFILAHEIIFSNSYKLHSELYFQYLTDVPVSADAANTYSALNVVEGFPNQILTSKGTGQNYGVDISLEKIFNKGAFFILSTSLFNSTYQPLNGQTYNTQYNTHYAINFMGGKEWRTKHNSVWQAGLKILYNGGTPTSPLAAVQTGDVQYPTLDQLHPFTLTTPAYFRPDLKISYRKDNKKTAYTINLEMQNFIGQTNVNGLIRNYDPTTNSWVYRQQSGLIPLVSFQLDF